jgi:hypothetical protein
MMHYADDDDYDDYEPDHDHDHEPAFADPRGTSALRAASPRNPRNLSCPTCHVKNVLTPADRAQGYQCDACANRAEGGGW